MTDSACIPGPKLSADGWLLQRATNVPVKKFLIRGERSSGTNFLEAMIKRHTGLAPVFGGWKHGFSVRGNLDDDVLVLCIFRAPIPWLKAMYRKPWHATEDMHRLTFPEFLRTPWESEFLAGTMVDGRDMGGSIVQGDRHPITGEKVANIVEMRNLKNRHFLGHAHRAANVLMMRYEALDEAPERLLHHLSETFGVARTNEYKPIKTRFAQDYRPLVADRPALPERIAKADRQFIRETLDSDVEARLGYGPI